VLDDGHQTPKCRLFGENEQSESSDEVEPLAVADRRVSPCDGRQHSAQSLQGVSVLFVVVLVFGKRAREIQLNRLLNLLIHRGVHIAQSLVISRSNRFTLFRDVSFDQMVPHKTAIVRRNPTVNELVYVVVIHGEVVSQHDVKRRFGVGGGRSQSIGVIG